MNLEHYMKFACGHGKILILQRNVGKKRKHTCQQCGTKYVFMVTWKDGLPIIEIL